MRATLPETQHVALIRDRVAAALDLLRVHAPVRYACLKRDLPRILVGATHNMAECHDDAGICLLRYDYVVSGRASPEHIAMTLAHEGMHSRLARAGFTHHETKRARIERLCVEVELLFARRLPNGYAMVADAEARLDQPAEMWTDEAMRERGLRALQELGIEGRIGYWIGVRLRSQRQRRPPAA